MRPPIVRPFLPFFLPFLIGAFACAVAACGDDGAASDSGISDSGMDAPSMMDSAPPDGAMDTGADAGPPDICDEMGLERRPFDVDASGTTFGTAAGDFSVETSDGPFRLSDAWSGCESYVFLNYFDSATGDELWNSFADPLFERSKGNVHYFFSTYETVPTAVAARMDAMRANVEEAFSFMTPEDVAFWRPRVHYLTTSIRDVEGSLGDLVRGETSVQFAVGIDRAQHFDPVGSLSQLTRSGFLARLGMAAYASRYYDYRFDLDQRLARESRDSSVTVVTLMDEGGVTDRELDRVVTLPAADVMATFDSLEVDVEIECHAGPGDCSEWDRIAAIFWCTDDSCAERRELVRWITPYSRPGRRRWAIDATPMLGLLTAGGAQTFRVVMGPTWETATERDVAIRLHLSARGAPNRPVGAELAYRGGPFDAAYDDLHPPYHFTPPAGTTRIELVTLVSGHGQTDGDNCAEWCNHEHEMRVNGGAPRRIAFSDMAGEALGCADLVDEGVIPGQYGNWAPLRAGWCPGLPVAAQRIDVTDDVTVGSENELTYTASFEGGAPRGGSIDLSTYVVYYQ